MPRIAALEKIKKQVNDAKEFGIKPCQDYDDGATPFLMLCQAVADLVEMALRQEL